MDDGLRMGHSPLVPSSNGNAVFFCKGIFHGQPRLQHKARAESGRPIGGTEHCSYPNPASSAFRVQLAHPVPAGTALAAEVYDLTGKLIFHTATRQSALAISTLQWPVGLCAIGTEVVQTALSR